MNGMSPGMGYSRSGYQKAVKQSYQMGHRNRLYFSSKIGGPIEGGGMATCKSRG